MGSARDSTTPTRCFRSLSGTTMPPIARPVATVPAMVARSALLPRLSFSQFQPPDSACFRRLGFFSSTSAVGCSSAINFQARDPSSAVLGVGEVEAAAGVPGRALVAVGRDAAGGGDYAGQVQQVPGHERGVAVGEVVLRSAGALVEVGRAGASFTDPAGVGLGR